MSSKTVRSSEIKRKVKVRIQSNEEVLFYWCIISAEWEEEIAHDQALLGMISDLWIAIRGFSAVSGWLKQYKKAHLKTIQKSKGVIHKKLCK